MLHPISFLFFRESEYTEICQYLKPGRHDDAKIVARPFPLFFEKNFLKNMLLHQQNKVKFHILKNVDLPFRHYLYKKYIGSIIHKNEALKQNALLGYV